MGEGSDFVGLVAAAGDTTGIDAVTGVEGVASSSVPTEGWTLGLTADQTELTAGQTVDVSSVTNQDVGDTSGRYVQYIFDAITDTVVKTCATGTVCDVSNHLYKPGEAPYVGFDFLSSIAAPGATNLEDRVDLQASSDVVEVDSAPWTLNMEETGDNQFTVTSNQDVGKTGGQFGIYLYSGDTNEIEDHCFSGTSCVLTASIPSSTGYYALVDSRSDPADEFDTLVGASYVFTPALPVGPDLQGETTSGSNLSEGPCACQYADPIDSADGDFVESDTDLLIPGVGPVFEIARSYDSGNSFFDGPFGFGWSPNFGATLKPTIAGTESNPLPLQIQVVQENGSTVLFTRHGASTYVALKRVHATLGYDASSATWSFLRRGTETLTFDSTYQLLATLDSNNNQVALTYDDANHVVAITASGGRTFTLTWTGNHVTSIEDSAGRTVTYGYNGAGELTSVTDPDVNTTAYRYDALHEVTSVTRPLGGTTTNDYNSIGEVTSQTDPLGRVTSFDYSLDEASYGSQPIETTTITSPGGSKIQDIYTDGVLTSSEIAYGTSSAAKTTYTYDSEDERTKVADPSGHTTTYTYDTNGNVLEVRDPLGHKTVNTYDAYNDLLTSTNPLGVETVFTYDVDQNLATQTIDPGADQRETQWGYFRAGTIATITDPLGGVTTLTYNNAGQQLTETDPDHRVTSTVYDAAGRVKRPGFDAASF
jgi:YD repeat-containing protein